MKFQTKSVNVSFIISTVFDSELILSLLPKKSLTSTSCPPQACTWGVAYEVTDSQVEEGLQYLHVREAVLGGYVTKMVEFSPREKGQGKILALVYLATSDNPIYLGPAPPSQIAAQIATSRGNTGHNIEYLLRLAEFMRLCCPEVEDDHLFSIEAAALALLL